MELIENIANFSIYKKIWICPATNKIFPEYILKNNAFNEVLCTRRKLKGIKHFLQEKKLI